MKLKIAIVISVGLAFLSTSDSLGYSYKVTNQLEEPAEIEIQLAACVGKNPKGTLQSGDTKTLKGKGWAVGCCLKQDAIKVNGNKVPSKVLSKGEKSDIGALAGTVFFSPLAVGFAASSYCGDHTFIIMRDKNGRVGAAIEK